MPFLISTFDSDFLDTVIQLISGVSGQFLRYMVLWFPLRAFCFSLPECTLRRCCLLVVSTVLFLLMPFCLSWVLLFWQWLSWHLVLVYEKKNFVSSFEGITALVCGLQCTLSYYLPGLCFNLLSWKIIVLCSGSRLWSFQSFWNCFSACNSETFSTLKLTVCSKPCFCLSCLHVHFGGWSKGRLRDRLQVYRQVIVVLLEAIFLRM